MNAWACDFPWPPSDNHAHHNVRTNLRILTAKAQGFVDVAKKTVADAVGAPGFAHYELQEDRLGIKLTFFPPDRGRRDIQNHTKLACDSLQAGGLVADDAQFDVVELRRAPAVPGGGIHVEVWSLSEAECAELDNWEWTEEA